MTTRVAATVALGGALMALPAQTPAQALARPDSLLELESLPGSTLTIRGSTTIGASWHCSSSDVDAAVQLVERAGDSVTSIPDVRMVTIRVPVSGLHCQNGAMQRAMIHALKADSDSAARTISGRFGRLADGAGGHGSAVNLSGVLRVAGQVQQVALRSVVTVLPDGTVEVHSEVPLLLSSFGIEPPRLLFGAVRARDAITIDVDLRYAARSP